MPDGVRVSHKHGWAQGTHADAGIVLSSGGDFVIVEYLHQPGDWLVADYSFPILREIARAAYNYFNMDEPYLPSDINSRGDIDAADPFSEQHGEDPVDPTPDAETGESTDNTPGDGSSGSEDQSQDGASG